MLQRLQMEREKAGGSLPEIEESQFVAELDELWWRLEPEEQQKLTDELKHQGPRSIPTERASESRVSAGSTSSASRLDSGAKQKCSFARLTE